MPCSQSTCLPGPVYRWLGCSAPKLKTTVNLDASRVVVLAKQAQNVIGDAFVNTWNDDYKIHAKNICIKL